VKQKDPNCARYGFLLAQKEHEDVVRHFGFHLLEHVVKARWNVISDEEKQEFKRTTLNFIASVASLLNTRARCDNANRSSVIPRGRRTSCQNRHISKRNLLRL